MKIIILKLLFLASLISCKKESPAEPEKLFMKVAPLAKAVRVNDTISVSLILNNQDLFVLEYEWAASNGRIEGFGESILFIAPEVKGEVVIRVLAHDQFGNIYNDSTIVNIYKQFIILKADDLTYDTEYTFPLRWKQFIQFIESNHIKASIGIIGTSLYYGKQSYFNAIKEIHFRGFIEFWNHGYDHLVNGHNELGEKAHEFKNMPFEYQKSQLSKAQSLSKSKLGFYFTTFGAPANGIDKNTLRAIEADSTLKIWFFGDPETSKFNIKRHSRCEIEYPVHNPDFYKFIENYDKEASLLVLQIHPNSWGDHKFLEFESIIDYLIGEEVTFVKPYEYYKLMTNGDEEMFF